MRLTYIGTLTKAKQLIVKIFMDERGRQWVTINRKDGTFTIKKVNNKNILNYK